MTKPTKKTASNHEYHDDYNPENPWFDGPQYVPDEPLAEPPLSRRELAAKRHRERAIEAGQPPPGLLDKRAPEVAAFKAKNPGPDPTRVVIPDLAKRRIMDSTTNFGTAEKRRISQLLAARVRRKNEGLRLWRPMPTQAEFHRCLAAERTVIGSNRSGKTTCAAVDFAWCVTGQHPYLSGTKLPKTNGRAAVVGYDWDHIGRVMYEKLLKPGAYDIIRDEVTGQWRPYNPTADEHRKAERHPAPPLIPKRMIKRIAWKAKALNQIKLLELKNGWVVQFFSSEGEPFQGDAVHLLWFDEEINRPSWYTECAMRLVDREGHFIWSATPHVGGDELISLHNRSMDQLPLEKPTVREFHLTLLGNRHISDAAKAAIVEKFKDRPEDYRVRVLGEFASKGYKVYPEFSKGVHGFRLKDVWPQGQVPHNWSKYVAVDPGRQICAVLFLAVPPPEAGFGEQWFVYDELYIENSTPEKFASALEMKTREKSFEYALMDMHAGRSRQISGGKSVEQQYHEAMLKCGQHRSDNVWLRFKEKSFWPGFDDLDAGIDQVRSCLYIDSITDKPRLQVCLETCPNLLTEFDRYSYAKKENRLTDKPKDKWHHLLDCLRYLCSSRPIWCEPKPVPRRKSSAVRRFEEKKRRRFREDKRTVRFGPGAPDRKAS